MSWIRLYPLIRALIEDPALGLAAKVEALETVVQSTVRSDFNLVAWGLRGDLLPTSKPNVMLRMGTALIEPDYLGGQQADGLIEVEIGFETMHADPQVINDEVLVYGAAIVALFNDLRLFSDTQPDPRKIIVIGVEDRIRVEPIIAAGGTFNGLLATALVQERSKND